MIAIIGYGEVGSSLGVIYKDKGIDFIIHDPYKNIISNKLNTVEVLNICFPCENMEQFMTDMKKVVNDSVKLIIIHSSIIMNVIKNLKQEYPTVNIVHSPVRGVHPNLTMSLKTFVKYVGHAKDDEKSGVEGAKHLESIGIKTKITTDTTTIMSKLLSTTYYGMCIAYTEEMGKMCDQTGADFDIVVEDWNNTYNEGYKKLNKPNVVRPVLFRIPDGQKIGGHCVVPNAILLKKMFPDLKVCDYILQFS